MINTRLTNILGTFTKNELKEFEKFIGSPYFNKGRNYASFLNILKKFYPKFSDEKLTPEYIYSKLYPGRKFNKQMIWNITSSMQNMAEEFLIHSSLDKNKFIKSELLADEFLNRKLSAYQLRKLDDMEKALEKIGIGENYFKYKAELEAGRMSYHFLEDTQHLLSKHITKKGEYAILNLLRVMSSVINDLNANAIMFNAKFDLNIPSKFVESLDMKSMIKYARENNYEHADILEMLYCAVLTVLEFDEPKFFFRLKELFEKNIEKFSEEEKTSWITTLSNYCSLKANKGEKQYREYLFEINKLELKLALNNNTKYLSKILFIQAIRNALSINETDWVYDFIQEYAPLLKPSYKKPMRALGLAYLYQKLKDFPKVLENLKDVKFIDSRDKFYVKSIYIRTYFETREIEQLLYQIDSAKHFVSSSNSLSEYTKTNFLRFLNYLTRLINAMEKDDLTEIEMIRKKLVKDPELTFGEWLIIKIDEITKETKNKRS